jgi:Fe-S cluster assembly ATP-binding protein
MLSLENVKVSSQEGIQILQDINVNFSKNTFNLILGPNGAGKTTLAEVIMGSGNLVVKGKISLKGKDITKMQLDRRAKEGIFLAYQNPVEIPGVNVLDFLHSAYTSIHKKSVDVWDFRDMVEEYLKKLNLKSTFLQRNINEDFSGGEKKKFEILQMLIFKPKVVILDEIDSGLDIDSVKNIFSIIKNYKEENDAVIILISHSSKILKYIIPDRVVVMKEKKILEDGDINLAKKVLENGYGE